MRTDLHFCQGAIAKYPHWNDFSIQNKEQHSTLSPKRLFSPSRGARYTCLKAEDIIRCKHRIARRQYKNSNSSTSNILWYDTLSHFANSVKLFALKLQTNWYSSVSLRKKKILLKRFAQFFNIYLKLFVN